MSISLWSLSVCALVLYSVVTEISLKIPSLGNPLENLQGTVLLIRQRQRKLLFLGILLFFMLHEPTLLFTMYFQPFASLGTKLFLSRFFQPLGWGWITLQRQGESPFREQRNNPGLFSKTPVSIRERKSTASTVGTVILKSLRSPPFWLPRNSPEHVISAQTSRGQHSKCKLNYWEVVKGSNKWREEHLCSCTYMQMYTWLNGYTCVCECRHERYGNQSRKSESQRWPEEIILISESEILSETSMR